MVLSKLKSHHALYLTHTQNASVAPHLIWNKSQGVLTG